MPIPDASEYTRIKRLQTVITENSNTTHTKSSWGMYTIGLSSLSYSLPNVLLSNKFVGNQVKDTLISIVKQIIENIKNINTLISQGISERVITQGAADRAKQYILSGGTASTSEFYIILSGGSS